MRNGPIDTSERDELDFLFDFLSAERDGGPIFTIRFPGPREREVTFYLNNEEERKIG